MRSFKLICGLAIGLLVFICCNSSKRISNTSTKPEVFNRADSLFSDADYKAGLDLVKKSDCYTCHRISERDVGPSFQQVANKYEKVTGSIIEKLSDKIQNGGGGSWGKIPMAPHPNITKEDADTIVKYILLTKYK